MFGGFQVGPFQLAYQQVSQKAATSVDPGDKPPRRKSPHKGFDLEKWRKEVGAVDESLTQTIERVWASLNGESAPVEIRAEAQAAVAPYAVAEGPAEERRVKLDWAAIAKDMRAAQAIAALYARIDHARHLHAERQLRAAQEDAVIFLLLD